MREFHGGDYDVAVIGAGHAGIEAALAAARMGMKTVCLTVSLDAVGNMPCNPAIGGTGKGHLVRELDALGGEMARAADRACIQYRMLNRGKGPAVHSLRVQTDRKRYHMWMKHALEKTPNLDIHQAEIVAVDIQEGKVCGIITNLNGYYSCAGHRHRHHAGRAHLCGRGSLRQRSRRHPCRHGTDQMPGGAGLYAAPV